MTELQPRYKIEREPRFIHASFEKAGQVFNHQPIPWNADGVLVDASLHLPDPRQRKLEDYHLLLPDLEPLAPDGLRERGADNHYQVQFRCPPIRSSTTAVLKWRDHRLGEIELPFLSKSAFLDGLELPLASLMIRVGQEHLCCETFIANQCRGLLASAVVTSPTSLIPLQDLTLSVTFHNERDDSSETVPIRLSNSQMNGRQALVSAISKSYPKRLGEWSVTWKVHDRVLGTRQIRGISQPNFIKALRVSDVRYVIQKEGKLSVVRRIPEPLPERIGPCFLLSSTKAGMAGLCPLEVRAQMRDAQEPTTLFRKDVLISDGITMVAPGTLNAEEREQVLGFELLLKEKSLAVLPLGNSPRAKFNAEGGFRETPDLPWSAISDEELNDRLSQLLET